MVTAFRCCGKYPAILALLVGSWAMSARAFAAEQLPFVGIGEEGGHLTMATCLPPGRLDCNATDADGIQLSGLVFVQGEGEHRQVRIFRLKGSLPGDPASSKPVGAPPQGHVFTVALQANPNPDHFVLHFKSLRVEDDKAVVDEAHLGRNCCGYYLFGSRAGQSLPVGRAPRFDQLMLAAADTYAHFERVAKQCERPGFTFVPVSRFSPSVLNEIVAGDEARPTAEAVARFEHLVSELDSDQFAQRESATVELVAAGRSTLWYLNHLTNSQPFSAEQQQRLRSIRSKLAEYDRPSLPFAFAASEIRQLSDAPPVDWLSQVQHCSEKRVADWARRKLLAADPDKLEQTSTGPTSEPDSLDPASLDNPPCVQPDEHMP